VSLAKFLPNARITATDISESALSIARQNAILNNVSDKINFFASDLFTEYGIRTTEYDLIVSNPPYICSRDIDALEPEVRREPRIALDGGRDGLDFYRRIINSAPRYLSKGGLLIMEMGFGQCKEIKNIFQKSGQFNIIEVIRDYNNIDRVIVARKAAANG
jgi:release factor glutamine methyltransferase